MSSFRFSRHRSRASQGRYSRKEFLQQVTGAAAASGSVSRAESGEPKVLAVVAHPDDEYVFAATIYRITHELSGTVDQVVITNGEAGYRYSHLAEAIYGLPLTNEAVGRSRLPEIRRQETEHAGRILGIRRHYFFGQRDARFTLDGGEALSGMWDTTAVVERITTLLKTERYDFVFVLLPTQETHGHHKAVALLTAEAVQRLTASERPVVLGSEPSGAASTSGVPAYRIDRLQPAGPQGEINYNVIVNWVIAEHKSQGLFQTECGKHSHENFWILDTATRGAEARTSALFARLQAPATAKAA